MIENNKIPAETGSEVAEKKRLREADEGKVPWRKWGPYLSERQWGTVREDYSESGSAWDSFTHDQARSRAYHWGEDGLAGISDDNQYLCFALALWNGADPILKERLFGLNNGEGNHGEDVKEYYYYLDNTPTHAYMKYLYKYPQQAFPYVDLVATNRNRSRTEAEYELIDTGVFNEDRYFDVIVEYAKASPEDILVQVTVWNRGPSEAVIHLLPTLWFRNTWSWREGEPKPIIECVPGPDEAAVIAARHPVLGSRFLYCEANPDLLFTENETNNRRIFGTPNAGPYVKDGINDCIVLGSEGAVNPGKTGTKAAAHYQMNVAPGQSVAIRLRLTCDAPAGAGAKAPKVDSDKFGKGFEEVLANRREETDEFWNEVSPPGATEDQRNVMRQALAGMLWSKQFYLFDVPQWLAEHGVGASAAASRALGTRNVEWFHMVSGDIISMPDKWEYPWFAAWDLAFHAVAFSGVDVAFGKQQLELMLQHMYMHPSGMLPAYEWNFSDVNPPVHAWAAWFLYQTEKWTRGEGDTEFLTRCFDKLLINFTWWVNRKDRNGRNVFEGGFLGLDNIGVFDRSAPLPTGGYLDQADGTAWMCLYCQNMFQIALELSEHSSGYQELAVKFAEHYLWIASAMDRFGEQEDELWDEEDGFFYDVLRLPDGSATRLKVRSMVGLLPLFATTVIDRQTMERFPKVVEQIRWFLKRHPDLMANVSSLDKLGAGGSRLVSILNEKKLQRILSRMLDENEFLGPYGIRSISRYHAEHPFVVTVQGREYRVGYLPAESDSGLFGGNSNWRGPVWMPVNVLLIRALLNFYSYYGDDFKVECPTGSGRMMNLFEVSREIEARLAKIFLRDKDGRRPVYGGVEKFQTDPLWRDYILFYEYFHGDNGAGIGANHQTGWTGVIGKLIQLYGVLTADAVLERGRAAVFSGKRERPDKQRQEGTPGGQRSAG